MQSIKCSENILRNLLTIRTFAQYRDERGRTDLILLIVGVDGMKCSADVNAPAGSTAAREMNYAIGIHGICRVRRAPVAVTPPLRPCNFAAVSRPIYDRVRTAKRARHESIAPS